VENALYYGDNLAVLRNDIGSESVDLVYLDPPFNSNASYNVLFHNPGGTAPGAQIEAFEDTWHWGEPAEDAFDQVMHSGSTDAADMLRALRGVLGENDMMAYLAMMGIRLIELRRVLKPTGSLYLHCDPTASHYLKIIMDGIFGPKYFQNEINWKRTHAHGDSRVHYANVTDTILFYAKGDAKCFDRQMVDYSQAYVDKYYRYLESTGRRFQLVTLRSPNPRPNLTYTYKGVEPHRNGWAVNLEKMEQLDREGRLRFPEKPGQTIREKYFLDEMAGVPVTDLWEDISPVNSQAQERLGYQTQKPVALLERIIRTSSREGATVLDPFCGCGTAVHAAQKLGRKWIGIDITHLAISLIERRLRDAFPGIAFDVHGAPKDIEAARDLAGRDKYQFQWWAVSLVNAQPYGGKKKGADSGIDGKVFFKPDGKRTEVAIVSVKGGDNVSVAMVRDLRAVIEREKAPIGLFLTLAEPTDPMKVEAIRAGYYETLWGRHPRLQILTIAELLSGKRADMPLVDVGAAFKPVPRETQEAATLTADLIPDPNLIGPPQRTRRRSPRGRNMRQHVLLLPIDGSGQEGSETVPVAAPRPARRRGS
jgi:site-specific DNA-methyltransferase (adenine-specific)